MATESANVNDLSFPASTDHSAHQYCPMTVNSSALIEVSAAAKSIDGILQDKPAALNRAGTIRRSGISKAIVGSTNSVSAGALLEVDANANGLMTHNAGIIVAKALTGGAVGNTITVLLLPSNGLYA